MNAQQHAKDNSTLFPIPIETKSRQSGMITRTCPWCKALLTKWNWSQPWKCICCGWE